MTPLDSSTRAHPALLCGGTQLDDVIAELEAGTMPPPDTVIWRGDLPVRDRGPARSRDPRGPRADTGPGFLRHDC